MSFLYDRLWWLGHHLTYNIGPRLMGWSKAKWDALNPEEVNDEL